MFGVKNLRVTLLLLALVVPESLLQTVAAPGPSSTVAPTTTTTPAGTTSTTVTSTTSGGSTTGASTSTSSTSTTVQPSSTTTQSPAATSSLAPATTFAPHTCATTGVSCQDCRNLQVCPTAHGAPPAAIVSCKTQNSGRPFCDVRSNQCTSTNTCIPSSGEAPPQCEQVEQRPDPLDCRFYIQCIRGSTPNTFTGYRLQCPSGMNYSPSNNACRALASCDDLTTSCSYKSGQLIQFKSDPSTYGYCPSKGSDVPVQVFRCHGAYIFDESVSQCQPKCVAEGNIPVNENCQQFYTCVKNGFSYSMQLNNCPTGAVFNRQTQLCDFNTSSCVVNARRRRRNVRNLLTADKL